MSKTKTSRKPAKKLQKKLKEKEEKLEKTVETSKEEGATDLSTENLLAPELLRQLQPKEHTNIEDLINETAEDDKEEIILEKVTSNALPALEETKTLTNDYTRSGGKDYSTYETYKKDYTRAGELADVHAPEFNPKTESSSKEFDYVKEKKKPHNY
jgi:hypothetical protein